MHAHDGRGSTNQHYCDRLLLDLARALIFSHYLTAMLRRFCVLVSSFFTRICLTEAEDDLCGDLHRLQNYEEKIYSQNGEDGVLLRLLHILGPSPSTRPYFVEFGVQDGSECITRVLREQLNYTGLMMDGGHENATRGLHKEFVTLDNVVGLFQKYAVPPSFDVLALDIDTFDFWMLAELLAASDTYRPRIIVVEVNPTLCLNKERVMMREYARLNSLPLTVGHPNQTLVNGPRYGFDGSRYFGANPRAFQVLGRRFGYEMVYCERCAVNCFMVLKKALPAACGTLRFPFPHVPYPCFASDARASSQQTRDQHTWHGLYGGHTVDTQQRSVVRIDDALLKRLVHRNLTIPLEFLPVVINTTSSGNSSSGSSSNITSSSSGTLTSGIGSSSISSSGNSSNDADTRLPPAPPSVTLHSCRINPDLTQKRVPAHVLNIRAATNPGVHL